MQGWQDEIIAVDWGTTNRRAYRLDASGTVIASMEDERGVLSLAPEDFPGVVGAITAELGAAPLLLAGMIGSNRGWREAPYMPCPVNLPGLARGLLWVEPGQVAIVPGVSLRAPGHADVMRGEEVQVFGQLAGHEPAEGTLLCHPGTHTKWIQTRGDTITGFRTAMTGELFGLLREHSILSPLLQSPIEPDEAFRAGVRAGLAGADLAAELFSVRARVLLGEAAADASAPWVSGLLVGADVRAGLALRSPEFSRTVTVVGRPALNRLYVAALAEADVPAIAADGGTAFAAGMHAIRKAL